jgi:HEAT repeat protein
MTNKRNRTVLALLITAACVIPSALVARQAVADDDDEPDAKAQAAAKPKGNAAAPPISEEEAKKKRANVLLGMAADDAVLINVTRREMPASPDVLDLGKKGTRALARCVSDNVDDELRGRCAGLLGRIGDKRALGELQGALEAWDAGVRRAAIEALRKMPDRSSTPGLAKILEREDEEPQNRAIALEALGMMSDPRAVPVLQQRLRAGAEDSAVRAAAFRGLWKSRHLRFRRALVSDVAHALSSEVSELVLPATFAASELREPELVAPLVHLMQSADARIRNRAVYALGKIGSASATRALLAQLPKVREARMLNNIAFALERLDPKAFYTTAEGLARHKQAQIRMNAAFVLGDVRRPEGLHLLQEGLSDKNETVQLSAIAAIGKLDSPDAAKVLERYVDDPSPSLSRAAIYAVYALSGMKRTDLVHDRLYAKAKHPGEKLEAALALARGNDPRVVPDLLACLEKRSCGLFDVEGPLRASRAADVPGRTLLAWFKGRTELTDLVASLRPVGGAALAVSEVQAELAQNHIASATSALDLAGELGDDKAIAMLAPLLAHESPRLRLHAAVALSRAGNADADGIIFTELDNLPDATLPHAARLLARVAEPAARARLLPRLLARQKSDDADLALAAASVHLAWEPEVAIFRMLDALAAPSRHERDLAESALRTSKPPVVTELLRRALARERRDTVADQIRRILDLRGSAS